LQKRQEEHTSDSNSAGETRRPDIIERDASMASSIHRLSTDEIDVNFSIH
jgi:hypothetical protein